jgi:hypothetical protein
MVEKPMKITLRELLNDYNPITVPITLVCAGNRRKEQNQVRKTKGFSWGPAGVSTALWTGVALGDVIKRAMPGRKARYVCMEGADKLVSLLSRCNIPILMPLAEWILWDLRKIKLGDGSESWYDAGLENERRNATARPWQTASSSNTWPNWRKKCKVAEKAHYHRRTK